jgi:hypothetical protein
MIRVWKALLFSLCLAALVLPAAAGAYEEVLVRGFLEATDVKASTVTVLGVVYEVSSSTRMSNLAGESVRLEDLVPFDIHAGLFTEDQATVVEIEARQIRDRWVLTSLKQIRKLPE